MGLTSSDRNRIRYTKWRDQGLSHKKALKKVPKKLRKQFEEDLYKSPIESHYGMKSNTFLKLMIGTVIGSIIFISYLISTFNQ